MSEDVIEPLSDEQLAELDAQYSPFPAFGDWPQVASSQATWDEGTARLESAANEATEDDLSRSRDIALRAAAFDTGAIEGLYSTNRGLTFTVAEKSTAWEQKVDAQGPGARALFEAQLRAFELVLDHATGNFPNISQAWLRRIHEEITAAQETYLVHTPVGPQKQPLPRGQYKEFPNHVRLADGGTHAYAPVASTPSEMERLLLELESSAFREAHPIVQASYAHYALVAIHPFADGNGRVARALASVYTYRAASVPLLILDEHRSAYFAALAKADSGDSEAFVEFVAKAGSETLDLVADSLQTAMAPQPEDLLGKFEELGRVQETARERDQAALEFVKWIKEAINEQVGSLDRGKGVQFYIEEFDRSKAAPPSGYRSIGNAGTKSLRIKFESVAPVRDTVVRRIDVFISADPLAESSLKLQVAQKPAEGLTLPLSDVWPRLGAVPQYRVENLIRRVVGDGLRALHAKVSKSIAQ